MNKKELKQEQVENKMVIFVYDPQTLGVFTIM